MWVRSQSIQATTPQVVGNDHICDRIKHKLDIVGICGAGLVTVDFLRRTFVLGFELSLDVC